MNVCLPHKNRFLRTQIINRKVYSSQQEEYLIDDYVEKNLVKLMKEEMDIISDQIFLVDKLRHSQSFNPIKNFIKIDYHNKEYLDEEAYIVIII